MSGRMAGVVAWSVCALGLAVLLAGEWLAIARTGASFDSIGGPLILAPMLLIGAVVASRRPDNAIGWLFCAAGFTFNLTIAADQYMLYALDTGRAWPALGVAAMLDSLGSGLAFPLVGTFVLLLFPTGRPLSARWRLVAWVAGAGLALSSIGTLLLPGEVMGFEGVRNPLGVEALRLPAIVLDFGGLGIVALAAFVSLASVMARWRRARGVERQQLKWIAFSGIIAVAAFVVSLAATIRDDTAFLESSAWLVALIVAFVGLPLATAIAILRHRLFDIDRLINRALVYALLSVGLALVYIGGVVGLEAALGPFISGSDLAIAASTLLAAALFRPLRSGIQRVVDRRFYRHKYDAATTIDGFATRLRDELDLDALRVELIEVVQETMQPAHVSLWLRGVTADGRIGEAQ